MSTKSHDLIHPISSLCVCLRICRIRVHGRSPPLGYRYDPEEDSWSNEKVFPRWKERYPDPPDVIGVTRIYEPAIDRPVIRVSQVPDVWEKKGGRGRVRVGRRGGAGVNCRWVLGFSDRTVDGASCLSS